jgi:hypothetical protein
MSISPALQCQIYHLQHQWSVLFTLPIYCRRNPYHDQEECKGMLMRIGGKDTGGIDETWIEVKNPATGELIDRVPAGTQEDVSFAVEAAEAVSGAWAKKTMRERGMILY